MCVAAMALVLAGIPVGAQEVIGAKIGVFNADRVLAESNPGQQALALFNQLREQRIGELQVQQNQIDPAPIQDRARAVLGRDGPDFVVRFERLGGDLTKVHQVLDDEHRRAVAGRAYARLAFGARFEMQVTAWTDPLRFNDIIIFCIFVFVLLIVVG